MRKRIDPAQAKAKRQKKILAVLGVVMVALLAFQLPKLLKKDSPAAAPTATAPAQGGTTTTTTPSGGGATLASANPGSSADLPDEPDPAPVPQQGQLVSFNLFKSKDPFVPQLEAESAGSAGSESPPASTPTAPPESTPPATTPPASEPPVSTPPAAEPPAAEPPATEPTPEKAPTSATISVNGISEVVKIGDAFPKADPLFRLASIKEGVAKITIAGGSLQDGAEAVSLTKDEPLTLMNTADGTKYVIRLVSVSTEPISTEPASTVPASSG